MNKATQIGLAFAVSLLALMVFLQRRDNLDLKYVLKQNVGQLMVIRSQLTEIRPPYPQADRSRYDAEFSAETPWLRLANLRLASQLMKVAQEKNWIIVTAESVTGGNLAATLARAPGAGGHFAGGAVCYKVEAKRQLLHVPDEKEDELYDLQTAREMALGAQSLYAISQERRVANATESYFAGKILAIATTGRAVSYPGKWEGGVYVAIALPDGTTYTAYFPHTFDSATGQPAVAQTKDEGMLIAVHKALTYTLQIVYSK